MLFKKKKFVLFDENVALSFSVTRTQRLNVIVVTVFLRAAPRSRDSFFQCDSLPRLAFSFLPFPIKKSISAIVDL